jgi:predicted transcriptional regulator
VVPPSVPILVAFCVAGLAAPAAGLALADAESGGLALPDAGGLPVVGDALAPLASALPDSLALPGAPEAPAVPDVPPAPGVPAAPAAPLPLPDPASLLPGAVEPDGSHVNVIDGTPDVGLPRAPSAPQAPTVPGAPISSAGGVPSAPSGPVAADMDVRQGAGEALQRWSEAPGSAGEAWLAQLPEQLRGGAQAAIAVLLSGLATAGAYLVGFRHVRSDNLLEHSFRHGLLRLVRAEPGIHLREVARRMGLTTNNAAYHLRVLEKHGLIRSERWNGKRVYAPAVASGARGRMLAHAALQHAGRADVLRAVVEHPGTNQTRLAVLTGQHQGAAGWHLRRLMGAGLVQEERTARECRYRPTPLGAQLLADARLPGPPATPPSPQVPSASPLAPPQPAALAAPLPSA